MAQRPFSSGALFGDEVFARSVRVGRFGPRLAVWVRQALRGRARRPPRPLAVRTPPTIAVLPQPERWAVTAAAAAGVAAVLVVGLLHHEMWRDELEIWLIARDSGSLAELFKNIGAQGHPSLWYLLNFLLSRVTRNPQAMQCLNLAIGVAAVCVFHRYAPFSRLHRTLFCFGYFPVYSYGVISRSYGLEFLLVWTACALFPQRWERSLLWASVLVLLAQTHLLGTIIAGSLGLVPLFEACTDPRVRARLRHPAVLAGGILVAAVVVLTMAYVMAQAANMGTAHLSGYQPTFDVPWAANLLVTATRAFVPLPDPLQPALWGSDLLESSMIPWEIRITVEVASGAAILACCVLTLWARRPAGLGYICATLSMLALFGGLWYGELRHHGQLFLAFIAFSWVARLLPPSESAEPAPVAAARRVMRRVWTPVLGLQVLAAAVLVTADVGRPFSNSHAVAHWIHREIPRDTLLVASRGYGGMPVAAWLDRPMYYPSIETWGTFFDWSRWHTISSLEQTEAAAVGLAHLAKKPAILILTYPGRDLALGEEAAIGGGLRIRHVARFDGALVKSSNYWLYLISH